jgi:hypothetical protein
LPFEERDKNCICACKRLRALTNQPQNFVKNETLGLKQILVFGRISLLAKADVFVQIGESEQRAQGFLAPDRIEQTVPLRNRGRKIG